MWYFCLHNVWTERTESQFFWYILCRPISIIRLWLDNLNFVISILKNGFLISLKYFPKPISVLKRAYVLHLLCSLCMFSNACWWKKFFMFIFIQLINRCSIPLPSSSVFIFEIQGRFSFTALCICVNIEWSSV